jgi:hypothetical protein
MRWYWGLGWLALFGIISGLRLLTPQTGEPVYAGKTVNQWLDGGYEPASMALHEIGPSAAPYILAKLGREDPQQGSLRRYHDLWAKTPPAVRKLLPKPKITNFDELRACSALLELGPRVVPLLCTRLKDRNPVVREVCAHALGSFRERGSNIRIAMPLLVENLSDPSIGARTRAAWALDGGRSFGR